MNSRRRALPRNVPPRCRMPPTSRAPERFDQPRRPGRRSRRGRRKSPSPWRCRCGRRRGWRRSSRAHLRRWSGSRSSSWPCYATRRIAWRSTWPISRRRSRRRRTTSRPAGFKRLTDELTFLRTKKRPEVVAALADAAAEGDRSENAEYIYRKRQLREIDRRLRFLSKRLDDVRIVDPRAQPHTRPRLLRRHRHGRGRGRRGGHLPHRRRRRDRRRRRRHLLAIARRARAARQVTRRHGHGEVARRAARADGGGDRLPLKENPPRPGSANSGDEDGLRGGRGGSWSSGQRLCWWSVGLRRSALQRPRIVAFARCDRRCRTDRRAAVEPRRAGVSASCRCGSV